MTGAAACVVDQTAACQVVICYAPLLIKVLHSNAFALRVEQEHILHHWHGGVHLHAPLPSAAMLKLATQRFLLE